MSSVVEMHGMRLKSARALSGQKLEVVLADGSCAVIDLSSLIARREGYWRLRQDRYFRMVKVDEQGVLCWPEGEDVAPESLGRYVVAQGVVAE
ncbi:MAG: hypothetical protein OHK0011_18550 [Turneriella sp.]